MEEIEVNQMSPLVWAYVGDSVYEQYIRNYLVTNTKFKPHKLHIEATKFVKAAAQAKILQCLENDLTEEENELIKDAFLLTIKTFFIYSYFLSTFYALFKILHLCHLFYLNYYFLLVHLFYFLLNESNLDMELEL